MEELRGRSKFDAISHPGPPAAAEGVPLGTTYEFESRKQIEEDIMTSLRGGDVNMIGICGMGGLGKTTMAKRLMNRALGEHLFDEVVMAVVSQQADKSKIQLEIAGSLGLNLKDETSEASKVKKMRDRLSGPKKILLVLDDIWEGFEVEELGIPLGCKMLLTSRNSDTLSEMNVQKVFGMKVLSKEEALFLFRKRAGTCVDDTGLNYIAQEVVEECSGLPIALITVGAALKDVENVRIWNDALLQLRKYDSDIRQLSAKVYNPLKLSYDALGSKHAKFVFLLCSLFGEDADILLDFLTYFCIGLGIFEGGMEEARNRMSALMNMLKSWSLLLDGRNEDYVRMHDVVRDVCMFIAKEEGYIGGNDCKWISSFQPRVRERTKLPTNLGLLFLSGNYSKQEEEINKFDNSFVEEIRDLQVLFIVNYSSFTSLPHTTESLRNLRTLVLDSCKALETISVVGELVNLEILVCCNCDSIEELPPEMKRLNRLKLLDLSGCLSLKRIGGGIMSSLDRLEELKMLRSFKKWEASWDSNERENGNATVKELEALTNLRCLEIEIDDPALAAQNMRLSSKLDRFRIRIGSEDHKLLPDRFKKEMSLKLEGESCLGDWIEKQLLRDTEYLHLTGNGIGEWIDYLAKCQNIRWLYLDKCETMEHLEFKSHPELEEILDGPISSNPFHNLKRLILTDLPALKQLWKSSSSSPVFHNLSSIYISRCPKLEEILDGPISPNSFHNLKELSLNDLPALKQLGKSCSSPVFHNLSSIQILSCPELEEILDSPISPNSFHNLNQLSLNDLPALKQLWKSSSSPVFHNLSSIHISGCHCLHNLGQLSSIVENNCLSQLQTLTIASCEMMEQVFLWNEEDEQKITKLMFPKLKRVLLLNLPNLVTLCQGIGSIEFPLLTQMRMYNLPNLVTLCQRIGSIEFPLLTKMDIEKCPKMKSMVSSEENNCGGGRNADIDDYHSPHLFCQPQNVSFDSLKIFTVEGNAFYCKKIPISFFNGLEELTICGYEGSMSLFTSSIAQNFVSLRELSIKKCNEIVEVIKDEEEEEAVSGGERPLLFPKLKKLELTDLCKLESFCKWNCHVNCSIMKFDGCSNYMIKIFNWGSNVSFSFHRLEKLTISSYEGRMSLFSSSMAANILVGLRKLEISYCNEMVKVIEDEKEEENVVSISGATTILFPTLQELKLAYLYKLESFCEWKCGVEFPSLRKVEISWCSNMKIFTRGPLITPNLESVKINDKELERDEKDLNGTLKQHYLAREKEHQNEEEAYDDDDEDDDDDDDDEELEEKQRKTTTNEDEETKIEIEEEQNSKTTNPTVEEEGRKGKIKEEQNS